MFYTSCALFRSSDLGRPMIYKVVFVDILPRTTGKIGLSDLLGNAQLVNHYFLFVNLTNGVTKWVVKLVSAAATALVAT